MYMETKRLMIRPFVKTDLEAFKKLLEIKELPGWGQQRERAESFLEWHIANYQKMDVVTGTVCFGIFDKETGKILGAAGVGEHDDLHETEIFYHLLEEARGKGYAVEAAKAITEWVITEYQLPYIIGTAAIDNIASQRVLERCGYRLIDEQTLLVHIENKKYRFKYYRFYSENS
ncbi:MAG: GNAT family N-acetyltransferase [Lachnospiraceae bacterium]|jgi:RimJ/RimL family protein N-acetyltransferase|nr:GNAT family N-acetyltransferase [Lachnospiraceae bacterium]